MRHTTCILVLLLLSQITSAQVDHWESVIKEGEQFQYLIPTSQPSLQWVDLEFDDSSWDEGVSGFGYGDDDDNTQITNPSITVYLRKSFSIIDLSSIDEVVFHMDYDDGFVAYLNGVEIARDLVSGSPPGFDQPADGLHEASLYNGLLPEEYTIDKSLLVQGNNMLAVEVHNESTTSSDMTANPFLSLGINNQSFNYNTLPFWFSAPVFVDFSSTSLPLVVIETNNGFTIPDEPKVEGSMSIINRVDGQPNSLADVNDPVALDYTGLIQIETRGSSSQALPKKSYGFTTYDTSGTDKDNVSLLGMPQENDWILNSLAFDPSLLRDRFAYELAGALGEYAARTRYCEVFVNGKYQGIYLLQEKLKADDNRIDINKIETDDNELPKLSGGYITKADKTTGGDPIAWSMPNSTGWEVEFIHEVPNPFEVSSTQNDYIQSRFQNLAASAASGNSSINIGYPSIIDIPSFLDFYLINELASNPDAYQFSTYFHKDRNGKLRAGPIWDINLSFGNDLFLWGFDRSHPDVWQFEDGNSGATFWKDLYYDQDFHCRLSARWQNLRQPGAPLHLQSLESRIDENVNLIAESIQRESAAWSSIGDHANEITQMKSWIRSRLDWMDQRLVPDTSCPTPTLPELVISKIHYHPSSDLFSEDDLEFIEITNNGPSPVDMTGVYFGGTGLVYQFPVGTTVNAGQKITLANDAEIFDLAYGYTPFGEYSRNLSNSGRIIALLDAWGELIDEVAYSDESPWPQEADGEGSFLELIDLNEDNNNPLNWKATLTDELVTSIEKTQTSVVFPNPGREHFIIETSSPMQEIRLLNLEGKVLLQASPRTTSYRHPFGLRAGIYILLVRQGQSWEQHKIIIRK